ncbi:Histone H3 [Giardia duodenalis]|uniref:Histone H3 n=1 Tax=Giardia intestinalis TaxID=5741 RepID=V6TNF5_GIAIN|nr:Histone H3 [Giardia intestinalis]
MAQIPRVLEVLTDAFNELLGTQNRRAFRMALISKDNGGY